MTALLLLLACSERELPTVPDTDTGTKPYAGPCAPTDGPLRFVCDVPGGGTLRWWPEDQPDEVREGSGEQVTVWGLRPDVETVLSYPDGSEARLDPGDLPEAYAGIGVQLEGGGIGTWAVTTSPCDATLLVVFDGVGRPRWTKAHEKKVLGLDVTPEGNLLAMLGGGSFVEYDPTGELVWSATNETGFPIHHDMARADTGHTYVLAAKTYEVRGETYIVDVLLVYDEVGELVTTWELFDHLPDIYVPTQRNGYWNVQFPGAIDFAHTNSVEVSPDGSLVLSLRWLDTVLVIEGDPEDPAFGTPRLWLSVDDQVPAELTDAPDLLLDGDPFDGQHHATIDDDGVLRLFDNREMPEPSRATSYRIDGDEAVQEAQWVMEKNCPIQGSAYVLDGGDMLLTCATIRRIERFAASGEAMGATDLSCPPGTGAPTPRAIPVDW